MVFFILYILGAVLTYYGVYTYRVIDYKRSGDDCGCDWYIESCEETSDFLMYAFWPLTIVGCMIFVLSKITVKSTSWVKVLIKKLLKVK